MWWGGGGLELILEIDEQVAHRQDADDAALLGDRKVPDPPPPPRRGGYGRGARDGLDVTIDEHGEREHGQARDRTCVWDQPSEHWDYTKPVGWGSSGMRR